MNASDAPTTVRGGDVAVGSVSTGDNVPVSEHTTAASQLLDIELAKRASNLWGAMLSRGDQVFLHLYLRRRANHDWSAVAKRFWLPTQQKQVAFGSGGTPGIALVNLSKAIAAGHWREDRPPPWAKV